MNKKPIYCRAVIIAHGYSEHLLVEYIKSNLHLPMAIYSDNNTSIQINDLERILKNNIFRNQHSLTQKYFIETEGKKLVNFSLMPIMDLDDTTDEKIQMYKSGELFKKSWLYQYIVPIWNKNNLDEVLFNLGLIDKIPNSREKGRTYRKLFPVNNGKTEIENVISLNNKFKQSSDTNMDIFTQKCLDSLNELK